MMATKNIFSIYYQNARGLRTKSHNFLCEVLNNNLDIICITETWLNESFYSSEFFDPRYDVFRCDRNATASGCTRGGGVAVAVRRALCATALAEWRAPPPADELWLSIPLRDHVRPRTAAAARLHVVCTYIPHGPQHEPLIGSFYDRLTDFVQSNPHDIFIILGDFNVTSADWNFSAVANSMYINTPNDRLTISTSDFMNISLLSQYNGVFNVHNRLLDLVFCSQRCTVSASPEPLVPEDPHHRALEICLETHEPVALQHNCSTRRLFYRSDFDSINRELNLIDWDEKLSSYGDVDSMVTCFYDILNDLFDKYVPTVKTRTVNNRYPPWYTIPLIKLSNEKRKFHSKWKTYGNRSDYRTFSLLRKRLRKLEKEKYQNYLIFCEDRIRKSPNFFWSYVKSKKQNGEIPNTMYSDGKPLNSGYDICEAFNAYFQSVFVGNCNVSSVECNGLLDTGLSPVSIGTINISPCNILNELKHVDLHKGAGSDGVPPLVISRCANALLGPVSQIFKLSIDTGTFPSIWKSALITPIPKTTNLERISEYRPISKLCVLGKIFEKIVTVQLSYEIKHIISPSQHGFFKSRSVETNMVTFIDYLLNSMDRNTQVDVVYTDFSKAFDKINHNLLLKKLHRVGVHGNLLRWIDSYIRNRSQAVCTKGYCSTYLPITSGVPQGSHLGPVLFTIYINDIEMYLSSTNVLLYADDAKIFRVVTNAVDCHKIQSDLDSLVSYCNENQLFLNVEKCHVITYTRKKLPLKFDYSLDNKSLGRVDSIRDLGIVMDSQLSFKPHYESIVGKAFRNLGFINRISKPFTKPVTLKVLYFSFVRSVLDFGSIVWNPYYRDHVNRLEKVQRKFIKILNYRNNVNMEYRDSLCHYNLLSLEDRRTLSDITFLYKILNNLIDSPAILSKINFIVKARLPARSSHPLHTFVPLRPRRNYTSNNFFSRSIIRYNRDFEEIDVFSNSLHIFKSKILIKICDK